MAIILDERSRVVVQGATGAAGLYHLQEMCELGTKVVAAVSPRRGGTRIHDVPVFESVAAAVADAGEGADTALVMVPARGAVDAAHEALSGGIARVIVIAEGVPVHDTLTLLRRARDLGARLIGPNTPGVLSPGRAKAGIMPVGAFARGPVGIVSRSGTLSYETALSLTRAGLGQSTFVGIGGDPVRGTSASEAVAMFNEDSGTEAIVMIGEIGGNQEEAVAEAYRARGGKPIVALLAGRSAPPDRAMGHAGALVAGGRGTYREKRQALEAAGIPVAMSPSDVARRLTEMLRAGFAV